VGLALFLTPERVATVWPWSLTPLTGRVIGGWVLSGAFLYGMLAREPALERARNALVSIVIVMGLLLAGAALHRASFDGPALSVAAYLAFSVSLCALAVAFLLRVSTREELDRGRGQRAFP
jgi:predicted permease